MTHSRIPDHSASGFPSVSIHLDALRHNLTAVRRFAPESRVLAAVKANAYGHGLVTAARALDSADAFGVARIEEALHLRAAHVTKPIVLLEGVFSKEQLAQAASHALQIVVHSFGQIEMLEGYAGSHRFDVWLKIDTGMNRLGFRLEEFEAAHRRLTGCASLGVLRSMTHLSDAEQTHNDQTRRQLERFQALRKTLSLECSIANSAGLIAWPEARAEWVRPGLMLYGASPFADRTATDLGLRPAMTFMTRLIAVRTVLKGEAIGYNGRWTATRDSRIAVAAVGYGDGYPREMQAGAPVWINDQEASVVGRVSMDMTLIDVTDLAAVQVGDEVTLWGKPLVVERVAPFANTVPYELFCRISERVARVPLESRQ